MGGVQCDNKAVFPRIIIHRDLRVSQSQEFQEGVIIVYKYTTCFLIQEGVKQVIGKIMKEWIILTDRWPGPA